MVNLVIVSHSAQLGQGVGELARQMLMGGRCQIAIAAGIDDPENPIGTDPIKVMEAIESVADADHVLVMMDIGSALLSAETAIDLLDPAIAAKVRLCAAPLVEGTLAATVSAATGSAIEKVIADAENALQAKRAQLGLEAPAPVSSAPATDHDAQSVTVIVKNPNGLHLRPASRLVSALGGFNARLVLEKDGKCVTPDSINQIALLQVRCNDTLRLIASGPDAPAALTAFQALAAENFGDALTAPEDSSHSPMDAVLGRGQALWYQPGQDVIEQAAEHGVEEEARRLKLAISRTLDDLNELTALAATRYSEDIAAIFSGHHTLLDDAELYDTACELIRNGQYSAEWAWHQVLSELSQQYRQLDDAYLQARYIDVDDLCHRTLGHLAGAVEGAPLVQKPTIILAENIFPSAVLQLDPQQVKGICLTDGSPQSHGGIIATAMGIPFLCQQGDAIKRVQNGDALTLDHQQVLLSR